MAARKNNIGRVSDMAIMARNNPYVQRLIEDRELRQTLRGAYGAARSAYGRMNNGKAPTKVLLEDRKLQRELAEAAGALKLASSALLEGPQQRRPARRHRVRKSFSVLLVGGVLALVLSKDLRSKALDMLFGSEEEFSYSSTTSPSEPAPASAASL